jgi:hypothetical protein
MVFLDEAGDHSLDPVDKDFPVFVLVFFLCEQTDYTDVIVPAFTRFKVNQFGHDGVILHSRDIRKAIGDFSFLQIPERRESFHAGLNQLVRDAPFDLIAAPSGRICTRNNTGAAAAIPTTSRSSLGWSGSRPTLMSWVSVT